MSSAHSTVRAAAVQASSVFLDSEATIVKSVRLIEEAADGGARLIVLPEAFVPGYPVWLWSSADGGDPDLEVNAYARLAAGAVDVPGPATELLGRAARGARAVVAIGVTERDSAYSRGTLYNTLLIFGQDGSLMLRHRKLQPTYKERTVWGQGDGSSLTVLQTPVGRIGGLICWENLMPLARFGLYAQGEEIHLAPTADVGDAWQSSIRHIGYEGRLFVISAAQVIQREQLPAEPSLAGFRSDAGWLMRGGSAIVSPGGGYLAGPLWEAEGILFADLDPGEVIRAKHSLDVAGHYARPDVFELRINRARRVPFVDAGSDGE
jgi:nitrilase